MTIPPGAWMTVVAMAAVVCGLGAEAPDAGAPQTNIADRDVLVIDASAAECLRLEMALNRFADLGLSLPPLEVVFSENKSLCHGYDGLFQRSFTPWRITICSTDRDHVYEHELAHAWLADHLSVDQCLEFTALFGHEVWRDWAVPPCEWGEELAAIIIQEGLSAHPLPETLQTNHLERIEAFEFLTGSPDPRLEDWRYSARQALAELACDPTSAG